MLDKTARSAPFFCLHEISGSLSPSPRSFDEPSYIFPSASLLAFRQSREYSGRGGVMMPGLLMGWLLLAQAISFSPVAADEVVIE